MKEAVGEANMTIFVLIAIGVIIAIFMALAPSIEKWISDTFTANANGGSEDGYKPGEYIETPQ